MDLTKIPKLIPNIFVLDERKFDVSNKLIFNFAGELLTKAHGKNLLGEDARTVFQTDKNFDNISLLYRKSLNDKLISYTKRYTEHKPDYGDKEWKTTEALFFPCSSDGETVNWGVGCVHYGIELTNRKNIYLHF